MARNALSAPQKCRYFPQRNQRHTSLQRFRSQLPSVGGRSLGRLWWKNRSFFVPKTSIMVLAKLPTITYTWISMFLACSLASHNPWGSPSFAPWTTTGRSNPYLTKCYKCVPLVLQKEIKAKYHKWLDAGDKNNFPAIHAYISCKYPKHLPKTSFSGRISVPITGIYYNIIYLYMRNQQAAVCRTTIGIGLYLPTYPCRYLSLGRVLEWFPAWPNMWNTSYCKGKPF